MENLPRPPIPHKGNIPVSMSMDGLPNVPLTWLPRPLDGYPKLKVGPLRLTGKSVGWQKPQKGSLPRPYQDPKSLLGRPCKS